MSLACDAARGLILAYACTTQRRNWTNLIPTQQHFNAIVRSNLQVSLYNDVNQLGGIHNNGSSAL